MSDVGYRRSIFTFMDILGFRKIVESENAASVKKLLDLLHEEAKPDPGSAATFEMEFLTFSDSTVRSIPIESASNKKFPTGILWSEMLFLVHLQFRLIQRGCFIRGGMTIGDIFINDGMVFGPAIARAYTLETEFAVYPRIVVDPYVLKTWEREPLLRYHETKSEWEFMQKIIRRDSDGRHVVRADQVELDHRVAVRNRQAAETHECRHPARRC